MKLTGYENINFELKGNLQVKVKNVYDYLFLKTWKKDLWVYSSEIETEFLLVGSEVRAIIQYMRTTPLSDLGWPKGVPIASGSFGYRIASNRGELQDTIDHMEQRGIKIFTVVNCLKKIHPPKGSQIKLGLG